MQHRPMPEEQAPRTLMQRLDRLAGDMNAFLLIFAIGLAILDLTCFVAIEATNNMPQQMASSTVQHPIADPFGR